MIFTLFTGSRIVHLNFRAGSTFPVSVCTVPNSMDRTSRCNNVDVVRLYASYMLNLLLLKKQRCVCLTPQMQYTFMKFMYTFMKFSTHLRSVVHGQKKFTKVHMTQKVYFQPRYHLGSEMKIYGLLKP